jgi:hypothetical protein
MLRIAPLSALLTASLFSTALAQVPAGSSSAGPVRPRPARVVWVQAPLEHRAPARAPLGGLLGPEDRDHRFTGFFIGAGLGLA